MKFEGCDVVFHTNTSKFFRQRLCFPRHAGVGNREKLYKYSSARRVTSHRSQRVSQTFGMEQTVKTESSTNLEGDQNGERSFTIVHYDLTSSEDERDDDKSYIYCSAKLSPPRPESTSEDEQTTCADQDMTSSSQDSESSHDERPQSKRPRIIDLSSKAPSGLSEAVNVEKQSAPSSETTTPITITTSVITIASSSEDEAQQNSQQQEGDEPLPASPPPRKPYALRMEDLPNGLKQFLNEARSFFTRPHSLERHGQHVAISTYSKAEERVLCEYFPFIHFYYFNETCLLC